MPTHAASRGRISAAASSRCLCSLPGECCKAGTCPAPSLLAYSRHRCHIIYVLLSNPQQLGMSLPQGPVTAHSRLGISYTRLIMKRKCLFTSQLVKACACLPGQYAPSKGPCLAGFLPAIALAAAACLGVAMVSWVPNNRACSGFYTIRTRTWPYAIQAARPDVTGELHGQRLHATPCWIKSIQHAA